MVEYEDTMLFVGDCESCPMLTLREIEQQTCYWFGQDGHGEVDQTLPLTPRETPTIAFSQGGLHPRALRRG